MRIQQGAPSVAGGRYVQLPGPFEMRRGGGLPRVDIAYEIWGELSPAQDNAVLLFTGLSPGPHAASSPEDPSPGWWEYMIGPGRPLDTDRFFVICVNSLGSCFGSTGPASLDPHTGQPYRLRFPELTIEDIADAAHGAMQVLGIDRFQAVVGASMGGMAALAYAVQYPDQVDHLAIISGAAQATPFAIAMRSLQREIIRNDPRWRGGEYKPGEGPVEGMRLARKLGLTSYRSATEWQQRFGRARVAGADAHEPFATEFQIEAYLEANARKFVGTFDANCYLYLSRAMDLFDLAEHGSDLEAVLAQINVKQALIVGVETDFLFPLWQQRQLADGLEAVGQRVVFQALPSVQGHDAFLVDEANFAPVMADFFNGL